MIDVVGLTMFPKSRICESYFPHTPCQEEIEEVKEDQNK